jgi:hypothetical protein
MMDFAQALGVYLAESRALRQRGASEDSLRDAFLHFLRTAFPKLTHAEPFLLEKYIPGLRVRGGFADVLFEDLIFEFKRNLDEATLREPETQLAGYLSNLPNAERFFGILTDGLKFRIYVWRENGLSLIDTLYLDESLLESPERVKQVRLWLDTYLFHEERIPPTTEDIVRRFGEHSPTFHQGRRILEKLYQAAQADPTAQTKFAEWQNLLSLVYGSKVGDTSLFLRHTYLALFARVLVQVVLAQRAPTEEELPGLLSGETFQRKGLENFGQADFFVWVDPQHPDIQAFLQAIARRLVSKYRLTIISEDLLKGLYQELVDPKTRHDLGEFYTPDWLAELTLRETGFLRAESPSLLDPACGSGTFLFTAIRLQSQKQQGPALIEWATTHLAGLEVHPLAVFIARTNFLLALRPHLSAYRKRLHIPIYMADALSLPERDTDHATLQVIVPTKEIAQSTGKNAFRGNPFFELPVQQVHDGRKFQQAISALMEYAQPDLSEERARAGLEKHLQGIYGNATDRSPWQRNLRLMRWLLKAPPTDSVWGFILNNASQPALLAYRKFDFVAGNPPWLAYCYVQRPDYQKRLRELVIQTYQLLQSRETHLFAHMELATLFFAVSERYYLKAGGTLAFVMPRSILTGAKQHAAFQKRYLARAQHLIDCEKVSPLFHVPTCVVIYQKDAPTPEGPLRLTRLEGTLPLHNAAWAEAQKHLRRTEDTFMLPTPLGQSPYLPQIIQGANIFPRALWFVWPPPNVIAIDEERPQIETAPRIQRQAKPPWKGLSLRGAVEAQYLYATLLSDDLLPFGWRDLSLLVLPLQGRKLLSREEAIDEGHTGLAAWIKKADELWNKHAKISERVTNIYERLDFSQALTRQNPRGPHKLIYNKSGTHLSACVIDTSAITAIRLYDLLVQGFIADGTTYWMETNDPDEAYYLSAVLNAPYVDEFIKPFQSKGAFGAQSGKGERDICRRPFEVLPIPRYDRGDERHRRLSELSRAAHERVTAFVADLSEKDRAQRTGTLRQKVRERLRSELEAIDELVRAILPVEVVGPLAPESPPKLFASTDDDVIS